MTASGFLATRTSYEPSGVLETVEITLAEAQWQENVG